jgi:hypothetical protein
MIHSIETIRQSANRCSKIYSEADYSVESTQWNLSHEGGNRYLLTYRGTDEIGDWIDNLDTRLIPASRLFGMNLPGKISAGFYDAFRPSIECLSNIPPFSSVFIEGHSLGHALAVNAAVYLRQEKLCKVEGVTFGGPRVGNAEFCKWINHRSNFTTVRRKGDIVPLVPPYLKGYRHMGNHYGSMPKTLYKAWIELARTWGATPDFSDPAIKAEHVMSAYIGDLVG